jgi:hypothetical protein
MSARGLELDLVDSFAIGAAALNKTVIAGSSRATASLRQIVLIVINCRYSSENVQFSARGPLAFAPWMSGVRVPSSPISRRLAVVDGRQHSRGEAFG